MPSITADETRIAVATWDAIVVVGWDGTIERVLPTNGARIETVGLIEGGVVAVGYGDTSEYAWVWQGDQVVAVWPVPMNFADGQLRDMGGGVVLGWGGAPAMWLDLKTGETMPVPPIEGGRLIDVRADGRRIVEGGVAGPGDRPAPLPVDVYPLDCRLAGRDAIVCPHNSVEIRVYDLHGELLDALRAARTPAYPAARMTVVSWERGDPAPSWAMVDALWGKPAHLTLLRGGGEAQVIGLPLATRPREQPGRASWLLISANVARVLDATGQLLFAMPLGSEGLADLQGWLPRGAISSPQQDAYPACAHLGALQIAPGLPAGIAAIDDHGLRWRVDGGVWRCQVQGSAMLLGVGPDWLLVDPVDGMITWRAPFGTHAPVGATRDGIIVANVDYSTLSAVRGEHELWRRATYHRFARLFGEVVIIDAGGSTVALDVHTGEVLWTDVFREPVEEVYSLAPNASAP